MPADVPDRPAESGRRGWPGQPAGRAYPSASGERDAPGDDDAPGDAEAPGQPSPARRGRHSSLTETILAFAAALLIALLVKTFMVQPFFIPSGSMENTLLVGDKILVNKLVYKIRPISRGDIVVFNGTGSWNQPARRTAQPGVLARAYDDTIGWLVRSVEELVGLVHEHNVYIKRVIGIPGDHVACCNARGQITVNGVPLDERQYLVPGARPSQEPFSVVVPPGRLWVMGDNRPVSEDSRMHDCAYSVADQCHPWDRDGTIPENRVIGRAFMIMWPPSRIRFLPIPSTFTQARLVGQGAAAGQPSQAAPGGASLAAASGLLLPLAAGLGAARHRSAPGRAGRARRRRPRWRGRRG